MGSISDENILIDTGLKVGGADNAQARQGFSGVINGSVILKIGVGTLTLSGSSPSFSGNTLLGLASLLFPMRMLLDLGTRLMFTGATLSIQSGVTNPAV